MQTQVEELPANRVRLTVQVPSHDVHHAVEHAMSDLAGSVKIPGFRKGKVPRQVLLQRIGKERVMTEAVESHIGGWFWNAAARTRVRPVEQPEYDFQLPASSDEDWQFSATVAVQPKPELPDWKELEVGVLAAEVPEELVARELDAVRSTVAELVPVEGRPVAAEDTVVLDLESANGEARRDYVVELGRGAVVEEIEQGIAGMSVGETKEIRVRALRRLDAVRHGERQGDQGEGAARARRRARALGERVRDAGRAARRDRVAAAGPARGGDRGAVPRRRRRRPRRRVAA